MSQYHQKETEQINTNITDSLTSEKIQESDKNQKVEENNATASVSVSNKDEPLEEVERVRTYLARKNSVSHIPVEKHASENEVPTTSSIFSSSIITNNYNNSNDIVLIDETITTNTAIVDDAAQHINEHNENSKTNDTVDDVNTSKDFESTLNNTGAVAKSIIETNMTLVTREALPVDSSESDSLENYMTQFQASSSLLNNETVTTALSKTFPLEEQSKSELNYEEPSPKLITENVTPKLLEEVTEITITVKETPKSKKSSRNRSNSQLSAVLYLKERKSKSTISQAFKKDSLLPLATSTTVIGEKKLTNVPTYSNEYFNSPLQKSETRWFVYPISANKSLQEEEKKSSAVVSPVLPKVYEAPKTETITTINSSSPVDFSANNYANQFRAKPLSSYEAADEDFFTEKQPRNNYQIKNVFDARPIKVIKHLGVSHADPDEYKRLYANDLVSSQELPLFINKIQPPRGISLAANWRQKDFYELEGDIHALNYIDLEKEGLGEYKDYLLSKGIHKMTY